MHGGLPFYSENTWHFHQLRSSKQSTGCFTTSATRRSQKIQQAWIQFAREGDPSHNRLPRWEAYETGERHTMVLGRRCGMDHAPLEGERSLIARWKGHDTPQPMPQSVTKPQRQTPSILERASAAVFSRA